jgi:hypothetical protein
VYNIGNETTKKETTMDTQILNALFTNLVYNFTWLADPVKNGVIFNYDPEAPVLDKTGKPTGKTFGKLTTTIIFGDGTKCTCSNSALDRVNSILVSEINGVKLPKPVLTADDSAKEAGIVNCIFKRMIGTIGKDGVINGTGGARWLKKQIEKNSYDQAVMDVYNAALKKLQAEENIKQHDLAAKRAHKRKVKRMAKQLALKQEAEALLAAKKAGKPIASGFSAKPLNETCIKTSNCCKTNKAPDFKCTTKEDETYVRPAKKFSEFTQEEKRAYWRAQKKGLV